MLRCDWPVPARMGFAVNRSQLAQSEWKETAQKGYFVIAAVCEAGGKNNTQLWVLPSHPQRAVTAVYGVKLTLDSDLYRHSVDSLLAAAWHYIVTAFNVAVDVNIAFCIAFVFLNSIQWPDLLPDTNVSSGAFQTVAIWQAHMNGYSWEKLSQGKSKQESRTGIRGSEMSGKLNQQIDMFRGRKWNYYTSQRYKNGVKIDELLAFLWSGSPASLMLSTYSHN